jgi:hypothetical protein
VPQSVLKHYRLTDPLTQTDLDKLGLTRKDVGIGMPEWRRDYGPVRAVPTDEFRPPRAGEWYLSGATPTAWRAPNDLSTPYRILRLVRMQKVKIEYWKEF